MSNIKQYPLRAFTVRDDLGAPRVIEVNGRVRWALEQLMESGPKGCTPIEHPGPRWSDYVFKLRKAGILVETVTETHAGPFAGHHARYVLRSSVTPGRSVVQ